MLNNMCFTDLEIKVKITKQECLLNEKVDMLKIAMKNGWLFFILLALFLCFKFFKSLHKSLSFKK